MNGKVDGQMQSKLHEENAPEGDTREGGFDDFDEDYSPPLSYGYAGRGRIAVHA
jgi:hypothetical protein